MQTAPQVVAVGHAIVDVLSPCQDSQVAELGLSKGTMTLIDDEAAERIYAELGPATEASGGSAANTAACLASLGAAVEFIGKVADDGLGRVFTHDIRSAGVRYQVAPAPNGSGPGTGRCLVMVTPDAEKTMCTNLGVGAYLQPADVDREAIAAARVVYLEGYLCGKEESEAAVDAAVEAARAAGAMVAFSASDPAWVHLHLDELTALLDRVDVLFANEPEALGLSGCADLDDAIDSLAKRCPTVAVTLGGRGCVVAGADGRVTVPARPVGHVVDTTGAGDSFAAGFLYGVVNDLGAEASARLGALAAAEIVGHIGARPLARLSDLASAAGLV
ncbi:MAG TPA: adenosine kinase [Acidimicrobiales bacterium]|nr:adenosine kinase [Acidimicrobiales bacterium]